MQFLGYLFLVVWWPKCTREGPCEFNPIYLFMHAIPAKWANSQRILGHSWGYSDDQVSKVLVREWEPHRFHKLQSEGPRREEVVQFFWTINSLCCEKIMRYELQTLLAIFAHIHFFSWWWIKIGLFLELPLLSICILTFFFPWRGRPYFWRISFVRCPNDMTWLPRASLGWYLYYA